MQRIHTAKTISKTKSIKSNLFDYFDTFILVTGDITLIVDSNIDVACKSCAPFSIYKTEINDVFIEANCIYVAVWLNIVIIMQKD